MSKIINIVFPHQLIADNPLLENKGDFYLVEEYLFFQQYKFHKQKLAFHRASMKYYQKYLEEKGAKVHYIESETECSDIRKFNKEIDSKNITEINVLYPADFNLEKRLAKVSENIQLNILETPYFINNLKDLQKFFDPNKKSYFQTSFYKEERIRLNILIDENGNPEGGKWTYDADNRKKYPKNKIPPSIDFPEKSAYWKEAVLYVQNNFAQSLGEISENSYYPATHEEAENWLEQFLDFRFHDFGIYEDAIVEKEHFLNHSLLSPLMNAGLLTPMQVVERTLNFAKKNEIPLNSLEGFIRQIIGWREFIHGMYLAKGVFSRNKNFFGFKRKMPKSFYDGTTGIPAIDETIKKVLKTGYCHHIERLMVLGNFMLLCEIDPDEVYQWFMELFIDAYDWVMVPNIYGMSQFADGGTFATKPYLSGSNYIKKMSNYPSGDWDKIWDGLFWRFVGENQDFFKGNPRVGMMYHTFTKMDEEKRSAHYKNAEEFLNGL
ncbi:cryptochrome/photolyase family protein [Frigoriflavimonas asaccharolytica]|uniref:Deoxyribodipyrimidine photolyase-related protein n=1 Tax=Frigoriflavimonas asaccharolytica TaxID=2735899 RepID=A0A8J8G8P0_9FLAO|nr:cryptochrome/photolyase family protein [Frigoriflavimonas asaccharolytica]NRS91529.1 deoxyribodipyrimidine photolyase-related protein [Frigoriflavimonas asaccharolytica]